MKRIVKTTNWLLAAILGLLGFTKCDPEQDHLVMYGPCPAQYVDYIVKGKVVTKADKTPVKGIWAGFTYPRPTPMYGVLPPKDTINVITSYTDDNGNYELKFSGMLENYVGIDTLYVEDVDGTENLGDFAEQKIFIDYSKIKPTQNGKIIVNQDVELTPKTSGNE